MTVVRRADLEFADLPGRRSADPLPGESPHTSVRVVELTGGVERTAHRHPLSEEIVYVVSGRGMAWIEGSSTPIAAGDVILIPAGARHATSPDPDSTMRLVCFFPHGDLDSNIEETDVPIR